MSRKTVEQVRFHHGHFCSQKPCLRNGENSILKNFLREVWKIENLNKFLALQDHIVFGKSYWNMEQNVVCPKAVRLRSLSSLI